KNHGVWPDVQRFDFVVRERPAAMRDLVVARSRDTGKPSEQHRSLFFALRELTGTDPGPTVADWKKSFLQRTLAAGVMDTGFKAARGLAVDPDGRAYVSDSGVLYRKDGDGRPSAWLKDDGGVEGLAIDAKGAVLAARGRTGHLVRIDQERTVKTL